MRGTMIWFNATKDHGFITTEEDERLYVHGSAFAGGVRPPERCAGTVVEFRVVEEGGERKAEEVTVVPYVEPRRARLRHSSR